MASFQFFPAGQMENKLTGNSSMSWNDSDMKSTSMPTSCIDTLNSKECKIILTSHIPYFMDMCFYFPDPE